MSDHPPKVMTRRLLRAELIAVGSELTVGETRDTNSGDLARGLTRLGVEVLRMTALPDDRPAVVAALRDALSRADLVITTGGLGPTPDDLTRESVAEVVGETLTVDPAIEAWLLGLYERRGLPYPAANSKQAWRIPSATAIPNDGGTAPGWWVDRPDGRVVVSLPGPPRELRPMWEGWVLPRLHERGLGATMAVTTLRLTGIGESAIADRLGALLDRDREPLVATYARADAVDVRITAHDRGGRSAADLAAETEAQIRAILGDHVWATGETTWAQAIAEELDRLGLRIALVEAGTRGAVTALLAEGLGERLELAETRARLPPGELEAVARGARERARADPSLEGGLGLVVVARPHRGDTGVTVVLADAAGSHRERRVAFLAGSQGRTRAALTAAAILLHRLRRARSAP